jgi:hypothetical protein
VLKSHLEEAQMRTKVLGNMRDNLLVNVMQKRKKVNQLYDQAKRYDFIAKDGQVKD